MVVTLFLVPGVVEAFTTQAKWQGIAYTGSIPPDVVNDVGPSYVMEMVNLQWQVWNKTSGTSVESGSLSTFFGTGSDSLSDPRVLYDYQSQRWFASILDVTTLKALLAASKTSDPRFVSGSNWYTPSSFSASSYCLDQPIIGTADDKVVLSTNAFTSCTNGSPVGAYYWVIKKADLTSGTNPPSSQQFSSTSQFSIRPAKSLSSTTALYMAMYPSSGGFCTGGSTLTLFKVTGLPPSVSVSTISVSTESISSPNDASQKGTTNLLHMDDCRVQSATWRSGYLWFGVNTGCYTSYTCVGILAINTGTNAVYKQTVFGDGSKYYFYPALQIDQFGNIGVVFGFSSTTDYPGVMTSVMETSDTSLRTPKTLVSGMGYVGGVLCNPCRWGDYFGAGLDQDGVTTWVAGEFGRSDHGWSTEIGTVVAQYQLTMQVHGSGTVSPPSGGYDAGSQVSISATPTGGYIFCNWVGSGPGSYSGTNNPAIVTMNGAITETALFYLVCPSVPPPSGWAWPS